MPGLTALCWAKKFMPPRLISTGRPARLASLRAQDALRLLIISGDYPGGIAATTGLSTQYWRLLLALRVLKQIMQRLSFYLPLIVVLFIGPAGAGGFL